MTLERLLTQTIEILPYEESAVNEYNDPEPGFGDPVEVQGYLEKRDTSGKQEETIDRETAVSRWLLVVGPTAPLGHRDRIAYDGETYEVDGTVHRVWNPRMRRVHHLEAELRRIEFDVEEGS